MPSLTPAPEGVSNSFITKRRRIVKLESMWEISGSRKFSYLHAGLCTNAPEGSDTKIGATWKDPKK